MLALSWRAWSSKNLSCQPARWAGRGKPGQVVATRSERGNRVARQDAAAPKEKAGTRPALVGNRFAQQRRRRTTANPASASPISANVPGSGTSVCR